MEWKGINLQWAYSDLLLGIGRQTQCMQRACDVLHDALIRFVLASQRRQIEQPNAYLRRIAHSVLIDHYREARRYVGLPEGEGTLEPLMVVAGEAAVSPSTEHLADLAQRLDALQRILDCLPPRCREVFWLARIEGRRQPEIAKLLGISLSAVERHLIRAMLDLRAARVLLS